MGDKTLSITRLFDRESVNIATRAVERSGDDYPFKSLIGPWARLLQIIPYTEPPLFSTVTNNYHEENNEKSLQTKIYDRQTELEHWIDDFPNHANASECSFSMTMRSSVME